jgi:hypothetical protein
VCGCADGGREGEKEGEREREREEGKERESGIGREREVCYVCVRENVDECVTTGDITNLETASQPHSVHIHYTTPKLPMSYAVYAYKKQINVCVSIHERQHHSIAGILSLARLRSAQSYISLTESRGYVQNTGPFI